MEFRRKLYLVAVLLMLLLLVACGGNGSGAGINGQDAGAVPEDGSASEGGSGETFEDGADEDRQLKRIVRDFVSENLANYGSEGIDDSAVYFLEETEAESFAPENDDIRIDELSLLGSELVDETEEAGFFLSISRFWPLRGNSESDGSGGWYTANNIFLSISKDADSGEYKAISGWFYEPDFDKPLVELIYRAVYKLMDIDVAIKAEDGPEYIGPAGAPENIRLPQIGDTEVHEDWEPVYSEGSYWFTKNYEGLTVNGYYDADVESETIQSLVCSRDDFKTYRGIGVGSSIDELKAAYGDELRDTDFWDIKKPMGEDYGYYWYSPWYSDEEDYGPYGPAVVFWIAGDGETVGEIQLVNMFD